MNGGCPSIQPSGDSQNYLVHVDYTQQLQIQANNLNVFTIDQGTLFCQISVGVGMESEDLFTFNATYDSENSLVNCEMDEFQYDLQYPTVNATLEVLWKTHSIDNPQGTGGTCTSTTTHTHTHAHTHTHTHTHTHKCIHITMKVRTQTTNPLG